MGDKRIRCPDCHRLRVRTSRLDPDQCPRCEVRGELADAGRGTAVSGWLDQAVSGADPGPFPAEAESMATWDPATLREWIAEHIDSAYARRAEREPPAGPEPARLTLRDRLEAWLWR
jgi:hypothetical protein